MGEIINYLKFFQSIIIWVNFNEGLSQFDTEKMQILLKIRTLQD